MKIPAILSTDAGIFAFFLNMGNRPTFRQHIRAAAKRLFTSRYAKLFIDTIIVYLSTQMIGGFVDIIS